MRLRRIVVLAVMLGACAGAEFRLDPSPSCSYRTERAAVPDGGAEMRHQLRAPSLGQRHGCIPVDGTDVVCWGDDELGQLPATGDRAPGEGRRVDGLPEGITPPILAAGGAHTCAIAADRVYCWGDNSRGQLGQGTTDPVRGVVEVPEAAGAWSISAGLLHTCVTVADQVLCWGDNSRGQLGRDDLSCCQAPAPVEGIDPGITQVAAGAYHTCAYAWPRDGAAAQPWCWGDDRFGALGDGDPGGTQPTPTPVGELVPGSVPLISPSGLVAGAHHTCMLLAQDALFCWGRGTSGELGDGSGTDSASPRRIELPFAALDVSAGGSVELSRDGSGVLVGGDGAGHTCARDTDFHLWCWGDDTYGQLGVVTPDAAVLAPAPVSSERRWNWLAAGGDFTCAVTTDDELWCWGHNDRGQLGQLGPDARTPVLATGVP